MVPPRLTTPRFRLICLGLALSALPLPLPASLNSLLPAPPRDVADGSNFEPLGDNWRLVGSLEGADLTPTPGSQILLNRPTTTDRAHLFTSWEHGDIELALEFLMPVGSNSGIYLQGRYEVQLCDSWKVQHPTFADVGGIYQRWDSTKPTESAGFEGHAPLENAARAPGLWQTLRVIFRAPKFGAEGRKIANACFAEVRLNGVLVQQNIEVTGPTRAAAFADERPMGPLMIQGDHGMVAIRHLTAKLTHLPTPKFTPTPEEAGPGGLFQGTVEIERPGRYAFSLGGVPNTALLVDEHTVAEFTRGHASTIESAETFVDFAPGPHAIRVEATRPDAENGRRKIFLRLDGPGFAATELTPAGRAGSDAPEPIVLTPTDRSLVQRAHLEYPGGRRIYTVSLGTPEQLNLGYDIARGSPIMLWRNGFVDMSGMWHHRGYAQVAAPLSPPVLLGTRPSVSWLRQADSPWPQEAEPTFVSRGYTRDEAGLPTFVYSYGGVEITDAWHVAPDRSGLIRTWRKTGSHNSGELYLLVAEAPQITREGSRYTIGDRRYYIDWADTNPPEVILRQADGFTQLLVPLGRSGRAEAITYTFVW